MNVVRTIARLLLGAVFTIAGLMSFVITAPPAMPGLVGTFQQVFYASHWSMFLGAAQIVIGLLFLVNRYVPVALIVLAAFAYNSFAFHITMMPAGLPGPIVVSILGYVVALPYRASFIRLFNDRGERADKS